MSRWKVRIGLATLFVSGILVGGCATLLTARYMISASATPGPAGVRENILRGLSWKLGLDNAQREKASVLVAEVQRDLLGMRLQHQEEIRRSLDRAAEAFLPDLNPAQRLKFQNLRAKLAAGIARWPEWQKENESYLESKKRS